MTRPADEDLHAYVDRALSPERRAEVEAWLAADPADAERVRRWEAQAEGLRRLFDPVADEAIPPRLALASIKAKRRRPLLMLARVAAALALVMGGGVGGWWLRGEPASGPVSLPALAMSAHVVFAAEVRHPVEVAAAEQAHLVGWLSKRLGRPLTVPDLNASGFSLMGGRLLPADGGPAAQFMYENGAGQRLTLYLRQGGDGASTAFRFARGDRVDAFYWIDGDFGYALVAEMPREQLMPLAQAVYQQMDR